MQTLQFSLHDVPLGVLTNLPGDRNIWAFDPDYIALKDRPTLGLAFEDVYGHLIDRPIQAQLRLPPYFSNLLPEGPMRDFLARRAGVNPNKEFDLLKELAPDLPGAVQLCTSHSRERIEATKPDSGIVLHDLASSAYHFSLAGIQLKFSGTLVGRERLTVAADGLNGAWIVKLPSPGFYELPEHEFVMMELARRIGIDVPETALLSLEAIQGLPSDLGCAHGSCAYVVRRFDRLPNGARVHMEDFAQIFGVYPEQKYQAANYRNIAEVLFCVAGESALQEFVRRLVFMVLIGNGDMHLKNWSVIYPDQRHATLAPAYDFISTICYLPHDRLALNFAGSKDFCAFSLGSLKRWASKARLPESLVVDVAASTIRDFAQAWPAVHELHLNKAAIAAIEAHCARIPLWRSIL